MNDDGRGSLVSLWFDPDVAHALAGDEFGVDGKCHGLAVSEDTDFDLAATCLAVFFADACGDGVLEIPPIGYGLAVD